MTHKTLSAAIVLLFISSTAAFAGTADLTISTEGHQSAGLTGRQIHYTLRVTNAGPDTATGVIVTDAFAEGAKLLAARPSTGACSGTDSIRCDMGQLAPGSFATIEVAVESSETAFADGARVRGAETDPNRENNIATADFARTKTRALPVFSIAGVALALAFAARGVFRKDNR
ncbi:MAG: DUF11 domain-containing protein [Thermoanaerobaculia bacterium]